MLQEKNAFVSLFSWLYANFIVTNSGNAGYMEKDVPLRTAIQKNNTDLNATF